MKILEVIPSLGTGGAEKFVVDLSNAFVKEGHDCTILTLYDPSESDLFRSFIRPNVSYTSLGKKDGIDLRCVFRLCRYIHRVKPDVVHVHLNAILYVILSSLCLRKTKYYATIHSEAAREAGRGINKWVRKFLFTFKLIAPVTISHESQLSFNRFYHKTSHLIFNGCESQQYDTMNLNEYLKYREGCDFLFFHAGRIHSVKNQILLVEAFQRILSNGVNAKLLIAGRVEDKDLYTRLEQYLSNDIIYLGELTDIRPWLSIADAFCLTSIMEGMPITIIESMSVGCVPIVTPVGGCINIITNGENGIISEGLTIESYYDALLKFVSLPKEKRDMMKSQAERSYIENFSIGTTCDNYIKLFNIN